MAIQVGLQVWQIQLDCLVELPGLVLVLFQPTHQLELVVLLCSGARTYLLSHANAGNHVRLPDQTCMVPALDAISMQVNKGLSADVKLLPI